MSRRRLIIFAKAPLPGQAKTRLCPPLRPEEAARLAESFLLDEVETFNQLEEVQVTVAYAPARGYEVFRRLLGDAFLPWLSPQSGGDLGERLLAAFRGACPAWWPVVVIGSDSPDLPPSLIERAFEALEADEADVVLGPTVDGGYYLVGMRQPHPHLFQDIPWSTDRVLETTLERLEERGLTGLTLPLWEDVDTIEDLERLRERLTDAPPLVAPRTRAVLRQLV